MALFEQAPRATWAEQPQDAREILRVIHVAREHRMLDHLDGAARGEGRGAMARAALCTEGKSERKWRLLPQNIGSTIERARDHDFRA